MTACFNGSIKYDSFKHLTAAKWISNAMFVDDGAIIINTFTGNIFVNYRSSIETGIVRKYNAKIKQEQEALEKGSLLE
jgi:hypothetical protein